MTMAGAQETVRQAYLAVLKEENPMRPRVRTSKRFTGAE